LTLAQKFRLNHEFWVAAARLQPGCKGAATDRRIYQPLRVTPVMEARIDDHVWSLEEIVNLLA
jgi:hypothetical protein